MTKKPPKYIKVIAITNRDILGLDQRPSRPYVPTLPEKARKVSHTSL